MAGQDDDVKLISGSISLDATLREIAREDGESSGHPPVELWNPERAGDIGMEIRADGSWWHEGRPIRREKLVRLFARILREDEDGRTWLVTPYEKVLVHVADAHFHAVRVDAHGGPGEDQVLIFRTNVGDEVVAGPERPLTFRTTEEGEPQPYLRVRGRLDAKLTRPVFYELADRAVPNPEDGGRTLGVWSKGCFFTIGPGA